MAQRVPKFLSDEQLRAIYAQLNERTVTGKRDRALLQVMADAGLRVSEALALQVGDLGRDAGRIVKITVEHGKGDKDRTVFASEQLADKLEVWLEARRGLGCNGRGPLFVTIKGAKCEPLAARTVQGLLQRLGAKAGIDKRVSPHVLRHTAATRSLRAGANLRMVQKDLGHANVATTQIYADVIDKERQEQAARLPAVDGEQEQAPAKDAGAEALAGALAGLSVEQRRALAAALLAGDEEGPQ